MPGTNHKQSNNTAQKQVIPPPKPFFEVPSISSQGILSLLEGAGLVPTNNVPYFNNLDDFANHFNPTPFPPSLSSKIGSFPLAKETTSAVLYASENSTDDDSGDELDYDQPSTHPNYYTLGSAPARELLKSQLEFVEDLFNKEDEDDDFTIDDSDMEEGDEEDDPDYYPSEEEEQTEEDDFTADDSGYDTEEEIDQAVERLILE